jgi:1-acyl-sn-glycerol-3-phosphate acyltransferase
MLPVFLARQSMTRDAIDRAHLRDRWVRRWSDSLLELFAVSIDVRGALPAATDRGRLVVANHRSTIDIALLLRTFGGRMVSRADLSGWPLLGAAARGVGTIFVDRAKAASGAGTVFAMKTALQSGDTVCLFPEGTTFAGDEVRPFHAGAFVATRGTGAEIVPVGIAYERGSGAAFVDEPFLAHLSRMASADPTRAVACVGAPIAVEPGVRAAVLSEKTRDRVQALVHEARAIVDVP